MNDWEYEFVGEGRFVYSVDALMCAWTEDMVDVLPGLVYLGQHRVASHSSPMPLWFFLDALPVVRGARAGLGAAARGPGPPIAAAMFWQSTLGRSNTSTKLHAGWKTTRRGRSGGS